MTALVLMLLASVPAPALEAEIDSQTREDDELPPASILPYTPRFDGKTLAGVVCGPDVKDIAVKKLLREGTRLTDSKDPAQVKRAVPKLQRALALDPKAGWAYLILGSAHAKLGDPVAGTRAYETYLLSCRTHPNADRVQRILTDYWRATGGKDDPSPRR
jgi:cytochrome c-type biogenesis protein CcmH/NrfG